MAFNLSETCAAIERYSILIIVLITTAGFLLRARRFRSKGIFTWDEAAYYREAMVAGIYFDFLRKHWGELWRLKKKPDNAGRSQLVQEYNTGQISHYAYHKAWHTYLGMAAVKLFKQSDVAIAIPSLVMGTFTIPVTYMTTSLLFGKPTGLAAAFLLAASGLHILHSRSGGPEAGMALSFSLMLLFSILHKTATANAGAGFLFTPSSFILLAAAGVFLAGTILFNPFWAGVIPGMVFAWEAVYALASAPAPLLFFPVTVGVMFASAAVCILISDLPFIIGAYLFPESKIISHIEKYIVILIKSYVGRLRDMLRPSDAGAPSISRTHRFLFYPILLFKTDGTVMVASIASGVFLAIWKGGAAGLYIASVGIIFGVFYTFVPWKAARGLLIFVPTLMIFGGAALSMLPLPILALAVTIIAIRNVPYALRIGNLTSGIRAAVEFVRSQGERDFLCTCAPFVSLYGPKGVKPVVPFSIDSILKLADTRKIRYLFIEHHEHFPNLIHFSTMEVFRKHFEPVFKAEDPCVTFFPLFMEVEYLWTGTQFGKGTNLDHWNNFRKNPAECDRWVRVYDIEQLKSRIESPEIIRNAAIAEAESLIARKSFKEASVTLKKGLMSLPGEPALKYLLAHCYIGEGRTDWAIRILGEIVAMDNITDQTRAEALEELFMQESKKLLDKGRFSELRECIVKATAALKDSASVNLIAALCYQKIGDLQQANDIFKKLLQKQDLPPNVKSLCEESIANYERDSRAQSNGGGNEHK